MDDRGFDRLARSLADHGTRRKLLRGLFGGALLAATRVPSPVGAARNRSGPGEPCRHDNQCRVTDPPLICAWNGFGHDGDFNCCTYDGRCNDDTECCGYNVCSNGFCSSQGPGASAGTGGTAISSADGGSISIGDINSGGNTGNVISSRGGRDLRQNISGGSVSNETTVTVSADGGTSISDASGGSGNVAIVDGRGDESWAECRGEGCACWQRRNDRNPCGRGLVCCRQSGRNGVCLTEYTCDGYGWPGDYCPNWCAAGSPCGNCNSGWCNWNGLCA